MGICVSFCLCAVWIPSYNSNKPFVIGFGVGQWEHTIRCITYSLHVLSETPWYEGTCCGYWLIHFETGMEDGTSRNRQCWKPFLMFIKTIWIKELRKRAIKRFLDSGGSRIPQRGGRQPIILQSFCRNLYEDERIWTEGVSLALPLGSATH